MPQTTPAGDGLKPREYFGYALGDAASNLFYKSFELFFPYFYVVVWGLEPAAVATMMLVVRFWDAANDPIIGMIADRTNSRWGKFRPYLLWLAIPFGVAGYLLFSGPDLTYNWKLIYAYATYTLMMTAYSAINVPYSSILGVISPSPEVRTRASSFRFVGAFTGGLIVALSAKKVILALGDGNEQVGFRYLGAILGGVAVLMFWGCFALVRERVTPPPTQKTSVMKELGELVRNRPWVILLFAAIFSTAFQFLRGSTTVFYFNYVVRASNEPVFLWLDQFTLFISMGMLCQLLGSASLSFFARLDKGRAAAVLSIISALLIGSFYFLPPDNFPLILTVNCLVAYTMGPTSALVWAMYGDVADYGEWKFGRRSTGLIYSASLWALNTGSMLAGWIGPMIMHLTGFDRGAKEQTPESLAGMMISFTLLPMFFALLKGVMIWFYPLRTSHVHEIETSLAQRRAATVPAT